VKKRLLSVLVLCFITTSLASISAWNAIEEIAKTDETCLLIDDGNVFVQLQHESDPMVVDIEDFQRISIALAHLGSTTYYEIYKQPLYIQIDGNLQNFPCVQICSNTQRDYSLSVSKGRIFEAADFTFFGEESIPVIMGHAYSSSFVLGDVFEAEYLFDAYSFEIIGFLKSESAIVNSLHSVSLDECIVMPSFEILVDEKPTDGLRIHYANKTSGVIKTLPDNLDTVLMQIDELVVNSSVGEYSASSSSVSHSFNKITGVDLYKSRTALAVISCLLVAMTGLLGMFCIKKFQVTRRLNRKTVVIELLASLATSAIVFVFASFTAKFFLQILLNPVKYTAIPFIGCSLFFIVFEFIVARRRSTQTQ